MPRGPPTVMNHPTADGRYLPPPAIEVPPERRAGRQVARVEGARQHLRGTNPGVDLDPTRQARLRHRRVRLGKSTLTTNAAEGARARLRARETAAGLRDAVGRERRQSSTSTNHPAAHNAPQQPRTYTGVFDDIRTCSLPKRPQVRATRAVGSRST